MTIDLASEIWRELKQFIGSVDTEEAADAFVSLLIDNDFSPEEIRDEFKNDSLIKRSVKNYINEDVEEEEDEEEEDYDDFYDEDRYED